MTKVTLVVPLYNEEEMLPIYLKKADKFFVDTNKYSFDLLFINDGSTDKTLKILQEEAVKRDNLSFISFSRNFGQDPALEAGLKNATGDVIITMDCDLQDPLELIGKMLEKYEEGYQIVHPQRIKRRGDSLLKKQTSCVFYHFINHISHREVMPANVSQFKLLTRKVVDTINSMPENVRLLRSEVPYVGFKTCFIPFERMPRAAGKTKYSYHKMFNLAFHTISTSTLSPLTWPLNIGLGLGGISGLGFIACLVMYVIAICNPGTTLALNLDIIELWLIISAIFVATALISLVIFIPSIYLKDIHVNTQRRPTYIVESKHDSKKLLNNNFNTLYPFSN